MAILTANGLGKYYGAQDVFSGLDFEINHGDKIALIGPNGVGKTTLLRILCKLDLPTEGTFSASGALRIGYLPQRSTFTSQRALYDEMLTVFSDLVAQRDRLRQMEQRIEATGGDPDLLERYGKAVERFELAGGYEFEVKTQRVLGGLGLQAEHYDKPVDVLSGGQKTRAQLAQLLLEEPNLLILDEPTNHLDLAATEWLEKYLMAWSGSLLIVSHDRYFMDKIVNRVWELEFGALDEYRGNYSSYVEQRAHRRERQLVEYEAQQALIAKTEEFVRRFKAGQRSKEARGRLKRLERMERVARPRDKKNIHIALQARHRSGNEVVIGKDLTIGYTDGAEAVPLFTASELMLRRLQRVALLGPNGCGKTTFVRTLLGEAEPLDGQLRLGASVRIGYLAQGYEGLNPENTVLQELLQAKQMPISQARSLLGRFLFSGDDVFKSVSALSGGERGRLSLAKLTLQGANLLVLDEPTSHLDIPSREILESVLDEFNGSILFISHDRYFIDALATDIWAIQEGRLEMHEGNYTVYVEAREAAAQAAREREAALVAAEADVAVEARQPKQAAGNTWREQQARQARIDELEADIAQLEGRLAELEKSLIHASRIQDGERIRDLGIEHAQLEKQLYEALDNWAEIGDG